MLEFYSIIFCIFFLLEFYYEKKTTTKINTICSVTVGELGTTTDSLEDNLSKVLELAATWKAVVSGYRLPKIATLLHLVMLLRSCSTKPIFS